jgi:hypothetical protein
MHTDTIPDWIKIAKRILKGEFHDADKSTKMSLEIGIRNIDDPDCRKALAKLKDMK